MGHGVPMYFTIQPGGTYLVSVDGKYGETCFTNAQHMPPGTPFDFWHPNPKSGPGWYVYGHGRVDPTGMRIVSGSRSRDPCIHWRNGYQPGVRACTGSSPEGGTCAGGPVECSTGILVDSQTDFFLPDTIPIKLNRTYRTLDGLQRSFGVGHSDNYDMFLEWRNNLNQYHLILPDGERVVYQVVTPTILQALHSSGIFFGSTLTCGGSLQHNAQEWHRAHVPPKSESSGLLADRSGSNYGSLWKSTSHPSPIKWHTHQHSLTAWTFSQFHVS